MNVNVVLFAIARDTVGEKNVEINVAEPVTIQKLKVSLVERFPALEDIVKRSAFSVNHEFATDQSPITEQCEVALIPPVSGG